MNTDPLTLSPVTLQRLKSISLVEKRPMEEIIDELVELKFQALIPYLEEYISNDVANPVTGGKKASGRETDVFMIPTLDPPTGE